MPSDAAPPLLIGIDDTDNLESRGTGFRARELGRLLTESGLADLQVVTRHQLLVSPLIPYTSHNSSACLRVRARADNLEPITAFCRDYLLRESAPGSDAGLCVASLPRADSNLQHFGGLAKRVVLTQNDGRELAERTQVYLEGLTGNHGGVIGALAAVGLHASAHDGRVLWPRALREVSDQRRTVAELHGVKGVDRIQTIDGVALGIHDEVIDLGSWPRTVWLGGQAVLLVEKNHDDPNCPWRVAAKDFLKRY
jgi:tRNA(Ile2) C34 agmatinyltransferase TiaS